MKREAIHSKEKGMNMEDTPFEKGAHKYRTLVEESCDGIAVLQRGIIKFSNAELQRMLGYTEKELAGSAFSQYLPSHDAKLERDRHTKVVQSKAVPEVHKIHLITKGGEECLVELNSSVIDYAGSPAEMIILRDISQRLRELKSLELFSEGYKTIFENSAVAITVTDANERIVSWNKLAEDLLQMSKDELYMRSVRSLYPEEEWGKIRAENVRQKGMRYHLETKVITGNQKVVDVALSLSVLRGPDGVITGGIGLMTDISEQKLTEEALLRSESYFRAIIEHASEGVLVLNQDLNVRSKSGSARKICAEAKGNEAMAMDFNAIHPEDEQHAADMLLDIVHNPGKPMDADVRVRREDGSWSWVEIVGTNLLDNADVQGIVLNVRDIDERKRAEDTIREREHGLSTIVDLSPEGIVLVKDQQILVANNKTYEMLGYNESDLEGRDLFDLLTAYFREGLYGMTKREKQTISKGLPDKESYITQSSIFEVPIKDAQGKEMWLEVKSDPVESHGDSIHDIVQLVFLRDITDRKHAEKMRRQTLNDMAERFKELDFLYGISEITSQKDKSVNDILQEIVNLIPLSWQHPEATCARIILEGHEYATDNFRETKLKRHASIIASGKEIGIIEVCSLDKKPQTGDGSYEATLIETMTHFLERSLIDALAMYLSSIIDLRRAEENIEACKEERLGLVGEESPFILIEGLSKRSHESAREGVA